MADGKKSSGNFLRNVVIEMKRVSWPTKKELTRYTWVVLGTLAFMTLFFAAVDFGISEIVRLLLD